MVCFCWLVLSISLRYQDLSRTILNTTALSSMFGWDQDFLVAFTCCRNFSHISKLHQLLPMSAALKISSYPSIGFSLLARSFSIFQMSRYVWGRLKYQQDASSISGWDQKSWTTSTCCQILRLNTKDKLYFSLKS